MAKRIGIVTCRVLPEPDPDQDLLLDALRAAGLEAAMIAWDDSSAQPGSFDVCVLRSTWNYYYDVDAFTNWLTKADTCTRLLNPFPVLRWNLHKRYLAELAEAGVLVVPTAWVSRGERASFAAILDKNGWEDVVIKPAVSAGSYLTHRFHRDDFNGGQAFLNSLTVTNDVMIQRFMPSVDDGGERALVWIDGAFTHAVTKTPRFANCVEQVSTADMLTERESAIGEHMIWMATSTLPRHDELLYARVDMILDDDGWPCLSELELLEPSLFLVQHPPALERFVAAIYQRAHA